MGKQVGAGRGGEQPGQAAGRRRGECELRRRLRMRDERSKGAGSGHAGESNVASGNTLKSLLKLATKRKQLNEQVSELTTNRLSVYLRCLNELDAAGVKTVSSQILA